VAGSVHALNQRGPREGCIVDLALAIVVAGDEEAGTVSID
jgi:hypothetical protein